MFDRRALVLFSAVALSCHRGSSGAKGGQIKVIDIDAPVGLDEQAISKCDHDRKSCAAVNRDDTIAESTRIESARGARAAFALDATTTLEMGEEAAVFLDSKNHVEIEQGYVVVRRMGGAEDKGDPLRVDLGGRSAEDDPKIDTTLVVRARDRDRAVITVEKGKLTLRSQGGQAMVLLSGETAELTAGKPPERSATFVASEPPATSKARPLVIAQSEPRGFGRMTARVPGRSEVVSGVRLVAHHVDVVLRDGIARTEVEEVFHNDTAQVLEGRFVFPLPADASISRLTLWVNDKPVDGEIVEKKRAAAIFQQIVDDTVRPRDPALLEWVAGGDFSLKIFPLPPKGSRKVRIAYDEVLKESGGRVRYVYPLSVGAERQTQIDDFSAEVRAADTRAKLGQVETPGFAAKKSGDDRGFHVSFDAQKFVPERDFVVSYARDRDDDAELAAYVPSWGEFKGGGLDDAARGAEGTGYFALRLRADLPWGMTPSHVRRDRAIVIDTSHSQSKETLDGEARLASGLARQLDPDERFVVLACDSACSSYPESGLAAPTSEHLASLDRWLADKAPGGSSDLAGALMDGARRLDKSGSGQLVYVGDGSPTSGELSADAVADRVRRILNDRKVDLRFFGAGRAVDEVVLSALAQSLGATYEPVTTGDSIEQRIADLGMTLRSPVIRAASIELPPSFGEVYPRKLRNLRLGEQVVLVGRLSANEPGEIKLRGELDGQPYALTRAVRWTAEAARQNPLVPRLWALERISDLESANDPATVRHVIDLSRRYHVMSRYTSLLVLENDQMFADYGIRRTTPPPSSMPADDLAVEGLGIANGVIGLHGMGSGQGIASGQGSGAQSAPAATAFAAPPPAAAPEPAPAAPPAARAPAKAAAAPFESEQPRFDKRSAESTAAESRSEVALPEGRGRDLFIAGNEPDHAVMDRALSIGVQGTVQIGSPQVSGNLPGDVIRRVALGGASRMRQCYEAGLRSRPNLAGRVNLRFVIGQGGEVLSAMDGGNSIGDSSTVNCLLIALRSLAFPRPSSGFVTVTLPITLVVNGMQQAYVRPEPSAVHRAGDDAWRSKGEEALATLRSAVDANPNIRKRHEDLVRGLLARGRFEDALAAAKRFVSLDPDSSVARELLAYAAAANDDPQLAATALDTQTETDPMSSKWHVRAARSFEAVGDERRACAHWRALAQLAVRSDEFAYEAFRCRARVLDQREDVLTELRSLSRPGKLVSRLVEQVETGTPPPFSKAIAGAGQFEAEIDCSSGERCPSLMVVSPRGTVFSPFTPTDSRSGPKSVAFSGLGDGTYLTLLTGGSPDARGEIQVRALGSTKKFAFAHGGTQTIASTRVTFPGEPPYPVRALGEGFLVVR
jgi:Ca-activated chloride channel family protein